MVSWCNSPGYANQGTCLTQLCSVHLRSRLGRAIRRRRARPAAPPSSSTPTRPRHSPGPHRAASRLRRCTRSHPPSPRLPARPPPSNSISLLRSRSAAVVEPRPPGLVYRRRAPPARPRRRTRPPARPAVVDYNVGFFIVFLDNTNKQYLVVI